MPSQFWVPIAIALLGNAVAVAIVIVTNRAAVHREQLRQRHESRRWDRDDAWRVSEMQREYYLTLYSELRKASLAVHDAGYGLRPPLPFGWQLPAYEALINLRVFGTPGAYVAGTEAYDTLWKWGDSGEGGIRVRAGTSVRFRLDGVRACDAQ